jgi:EAL domain-containing protein (putative c-di-GMP-specific phosphodiesterase class I)
MALLKKGCVQFQVLHELIDMGFKFALDDFGVGWSCLSLVKRIPFNRIKIDQSFVATTMLVKKDKILGMFT